MQELALAEGVGIYSLGSGAAYDFSDCAYSERTVVLGYSSLNERQIEAGIERIARAVVRWRMNGVTKTDKPVQDRTPRKAAVSE